MELSPQVQKLYQQLLSQLNKFGDVLVEEKKTSIHLKNRAGFAGVHPRKEYMLLEIVSNKPITGKRILKTEQVSKSRFHNKVKIENPEDIDSELLQWLKEAHELMR